MPTVARLSRRLFTRVASRRPTWLALGVALGVVGASFPGAGQAVQSAGRIATLPRLAGGDCADLVMRYTIAKSRDTARAAYPCYSGLEAQGITEEQFVRQVGEIAMPIAGQVRRVGEYQAADGERIVYYALDGPTQTVGYTVYLTPDGKVRRVA